MTVTATLGGEKTATLAVEFKITDTDKAKEMLSILSDMLGDEAIPTDYKERIAKIISK